MTKACLGLARESPCHVDGKRFTKHLVSETTEILAFDWLRAYLTVKITEKTPHEMVIAPGNPQECN